MKTRVGVVGSEPELCEVTSRVSGERGGKVLADAGVCEGLCLPAETLWSACCGVSQQPSSPGLGAGMAKDRMRVWY